MMWRLIPSVAAMSDAESDDLGAWKVSRVADDLGGGFQEVRVAADSGHQFGFGRFVAIRDISIEAYPVDLVADFERIDRQVSGLHKIQLGTQALGKFYGVYLTYLRRALRPTTAFAEVFAGVLILIAFVVVCPRRQNIRQEFQVVLLREFNFIDEGGHGLRGGCRENVAKPGRAQSMNAA